MVGPPANAAPVTEKKSERAPVAVGVPPASDSSRQPTASPLAAERPQPLGSTTAATAAPAKPSGTTSFTPPEAPGTWQAVTRADIERDLTFDRLPRDTGIVTPIADLSQEPDQDLADQIASLGTLLPTWQPGQVADPVQRARNLLSVAGVIDVAQSAMEPFAPALIFDELRRSIPEADLTKVLYWIAIHPEGGSVPAVPDYVALGIRNVPPDIEEIRNRTAIYGVKLLGRLTGHIR
jgi:hypothetical protein